MSDSMIDAWFGDAYRLAIVEGDVPGAIVICDRILDQDPSHHNAKMLKGCLLGDSPNASARKTARQLFRSAMIARGLQRTSDDDWLEENPVYQLGVSFLKDSESRAAVAAFAIDFILNRTENSRAELLALLSDEDGAVDAVKDMLALHEPPSQ